MCNSLKIEENNGFNDLAMKVIMIEDCLLWVAEKSWANGACLCVCVLSKHFSAWSLNCFFGSGPGSQRVYDEKLGHIQPLVAKYRPNLFARLRDIAEKQVHANLRPILVLRRLRINLLLSYIRFFFCL